MNKAEKKQSLIREISKARNTPRMQSFIRRKSYQIIAIHHLKSLRKKRLREKLII
jgi:hypothetical protein